jgi:hypothetical protein
MQKNMRGNGEQWAPFFVLSGKESEHATFLADWSFESRSAAGVLLRADDRPGRPAGTRRSCTG